MQSNNRAMSFQPSYSAARTENISIHVAPAHSTADPSQQQHRSAAASTRSRPGRGPGHWAWQRWPGRNQPFACCGHVVLLARDHCTLWTSILLILGNAGLFLAFVARHVHESVLAVGCLFTLAPFTLLMLTTFTEAGILPRKRLEDYPNQAVEAAEQQAQSSPGWGQGTPGNNGPLYPAPTAVIEGHVVPLKWCKTCCIYRPPRASHCRDCDCCVEEFDHRQ